MRPHRRALWALLGLVIVLGAVPSGCGGDPGETVSLVLDVVPVAEPDPLGAAEADFKVASLELAGRQGDEVLFRRVADYDQGAGLSSLDLTGLDGQSGELAFPLDDVTLALSGFNAAGVLVAQGCTEPVRLAVGTETRAALLFARVDTSSRLTAALTEPRWGHTATALGDGRVLVFGGARAARDGAPADVIAAPEIVDVRTGVVRSLSAAGLAGRVFHSATAVESGVLILGGLSNSNTPLGSAVLFDAVNETFGSEFSVSARAAHAATARSDGVVVAGGLTVGAGDALPPLLGPVQLPDGLGVTDSVDFIQLNGGEAIVAPLAALAGGARAFAVAVAVGGRAFVAGGIGLDGVSGAVEQYPQNGVPELLGMMSTPRYGAAAAYGVSSVLVAGGVSGDGTPLESGSLIVYNESLDLEPSLADAPPMASGRGGFGLATLDDGRAVALGGWTDAPELDLAGRTEEYDPASGFAQTGALRQPRAYAAVASLDNGRALTCGGLAPLGDDGALVPQASIEIYLRGHEADR